MSRIIIALALAVLLAKPAFAEWYDGGTLHKATLGEWRAATATNRLATAGDWAAAIMKKDGAERIDFDHLRTFAEELVACVDEVAVEASVASQSAGEIAVVCFILLDQ